MNRSRRSIPETGSFGKSTRRSRSKTGTPARREDPTLTAADKVFTSWIQDRNKAVAAQGGSSSGRKTSSPPDEATSHAASTSHRVLKKPTEMVLRGYRSSAQQYAAINHYEQLAGRVCEDYPRGPPSEARRYKSELRDPGLARRQPLTVEERRCVNRADAGEYWVKVTFESEEAADAAMSVSPQSVLGYLVYAEPYAGRPPPRDEPIPDNGFEKEAAMFMGDMRRRSPPRRRSSRLPDFSSGFGGGAMSGRFGDIYNGSAQSSSQTVETGTIVGGEGSTGTVSSGTITGGFVAPRPDVTMDGAADSQARNDEFCRKIPTARRAKLMPAEQALLPQPSAFERLGGSIPLLGWFNGTVIGNEVPRTETGEFDWDKASLYWTVMGLLDYYLCCFRGEVINADSDKED